VVNKADHPQANKTLADIRDLLRMEIAPRAWTPPIVKTVALHNEGLEDLWIRIQQHRQFLERTGEMETRRKQRLEREILEIADRRLREQVLQPRTETAEFQQLLESVVQRETDPYAVADRIVPRNAAGGK
jgi:LAO/AO transport system kinase